MTAFEDELRHLIETHQGNGADLEEMIAALEEEMNRLELAVPPKDEPSGG